MSFKLHSFMCDLSIGALPNHHLMIYLLSALCVLNHVQIFVTPWTVARQAPLSMGFSRQEYWSGLPCPSPGDLPEPVIKPASLASSILADGFFFYHCAT